MFESMIEAFVPPVTIAGYFRASSKDPGAADPGVPIAGAGRNITPVTTSDHNSVAGPAVSISAYNGPFKSPSVSTVETPIESLFRPPAKLLGGSIGGDRARSKQSSNQSRSEHPITHPVPHGNLPFVPLT